MSVSFWDANSTAGSGSFWSTHDDISTTRERLEPQIIQTEARPTHTETSVDDIIQMLRDEYNIDEDGSWKDIWSKWRLGLDSIKPPKHIRELREEKELNDTIHDMIRDKLK